VPAVVLPWDAPMQARRFGNSVQVLPVQEVALLWHATLQATSTASSIHALPELATQNMMSDHALPMMVVVSLWCPKLQVYAMPVLPLELVEPSVLW
jgi:hypothetical protein